MKIGVSPGDGTADGLVLRFSCGSEPAAQLGITRVDEQLFTRLHVLYVQQPGIGQLVLAGIGQPDRNDLVPFGKTQQWPLPPGFADEIGDQYNQRPAAHDSCGIIEQPAQVGRRPPIYREQQFAYQSEHLVTDPDGEGSSTAERRRTAWRRGDCRRA